MNNFKEIAEKCLKGELSGTFILRNDARIPSKQLHRKNIGDMDYPYALYGIPMNTYTDDGRIYITQIDDFDVINFIPDMEERNVKLTLDKAKEWYEKGGELKEVALQAYKEEELKDSKPRSWEEYYTQMSGQLGFFIASNSSIQNCRYSDHSNPKYDQNTLPTQELAEAFLAYMQLISLHQAWIGDWKPNWNDNTQSKYCIFYNHFDPFVNININVHRSLSFPSEEMANDFLDTFRELIEQAKSLI